MLTCKTPNKICSRFVPVSRNQIKLDFSHEPFLFPPPPKKQRKISYAVHHHHHSSLPYYSNGFWPLLIGNLCNLFGPRSWGSTECPFWSGHFDSVPERIFWNSWFWKKSADEKKHEKLPCLGTGPLFFVCLFDWILYIPVSNFPVMSGWVFLGSFSRDLTIPHLDLSHFALCIMGN